MTLSFDPDRVDLPLHHFVGGRRVDAQGVIELRRPSDGQPFALCPVADAGLVDDTVAAASSAVRESGWGGVPPRERARALHRWADLIEANAADLARVEAVASTRPVAQLATGDIAITAEQIRFFAEFADKECDDLVPTGDGTLGLIMSEPYGVVGAITPWNFPISMAGWKLGPALAAGNAVIIKPSEMTPFSTLRLAELSVEAGIPAGLVNVVLGDGPVTGSAITAHPGIGKISFTGSTAAGATIMANVARTAIRPVTLELGGKSPQLVFADADLDLASRAVAAGVLSNAGQACVAGTRLIAEEGIADALAQAILKRFDEVRPGSTWDETTTFPPIISERQVDRMDTIVRASVDGGAERLRGGQRLDRTGYFYAPTLIGGLKPDSPALTEEIFGPVLTIQTFREEDEAVALADHPTYGLAAGLFTKDLSRAIRLTRRLEAGTVWVNRYGRSRDHILPTGGYKSSGVGKDLGREAYRANRRTKSVLIGL